MLIVIQGGVVLDRLVVQGNQMVNSLARLLDGQFVFPLFNGFQERIDFEFAHGAGRDFGLADFSLFVEPFLGLNAVLFEAAADQGDAVLRVLVHLDREDPRLYVLLERAESNRHLFHILH